MRVPNFLQNLFGEGVLSASFIPVYSRLLAEGEKEEADRVAGAVGAILALASAVLVLIGVLATPWLMRAIAPGFHGAKRELTILLVRILFPGAGLLVCSAWCLGILNSHRKFFLSYTAPVVWNLAMIAHDPDVPPSAAARPRDQARVGHGIGLRAAIPGPGAGGVRATRQAADHASDALGACSRGAEEFRAGGRQPRRGADQCVTWIRRSRR